jgi:hypothetical protein
MKVSTADFIKNYGTLADKALTEPVTITKNDRDLPVFGQMRIGIDQRLDIANSQVGKGRYAGSRFGVAECIAVDIALPPEC